MTPPLRVQLLGPVRAWRGDQEVDLGSAGRRAVFAILALAAGRAVTREELVDGIWGDDPPARAVGILHTYVSDLRRSLQEQVRGSRPSAEPVLDSVGSAYALRIRPEQLDVTEFDELRSTADDLGGSLRSVTAALALWQGEALSGLSGPFAELHRARLAELRLAALERRCALLLALGDQDTAIAELTGLAREHPRREGLRGLLMVALYQAGRRDEALAEFERAREVLVAELGLDPGPALQDIHDRIVAHQKVPIPGVATQHDQLAASTRQPEAPTEFVGRQREVAWLRALVVALADGAGGCVLVEGEPGIGKSALLAVGLADAPVAGCRVVWALGEDLSGDGPLAPISRLLSFVDQACAEAPLVLVIDDVQWLDETGLLAWHRLSRLTQQLPLLLVGARRTNPTAHHVDLAGGRTLAIGPLHEDDVHELAARLAGASLGAVLRELVDRAAGNPLHVRELVDGLLRDSVLRTVDDFADVDPSSGFDVHRAMAEVATRRLEFLSPTALDRLRWAALLGVEFDLADLAAIVGASPADLVGAIEEATDAGLLADAGNRLAFRDPAVRQALYEERPAAVRTTLHRESAKALAHAGAPLERIAAQLAAAGVFDHWSVQWLLANAETVAGRDPALVLALLDSALESTSPTPEEREVLLVSQVRWQFRLGRQPEAAARALLDVTRDPAHAAEMRWILACLTYGRGDVAQAIADLRAAAADPAAPDFWVARHDTLRAQFERTGLDDLDTAETTAIAALGQATDANDAPAIAAAEQELWYVESVRRNHSAALAHVNNALAAATGNQHLVDLQINLLGARLFSLQNLDRLTDGTDTVARTHALVRRTGRPSGRVHIGAAVHYYWLARWDEALAELDSIVGDEPEITIFDLRSRVPLLQYGTAALITGHRGDSEQLHAHLRTASSYPVIAPGDQENSDFYLSAKAMAAEQDGDLAGAVAAYEPILDTSYGRMTLRHQWLPDLTRLALDAGAPDVAQAALRLAQAEASSETVPARAFNAAQRCASLISGDPAPLVAVARRYRDVGRRIEFAVTSEDAAVLLARRGEVDRARRTFQEALLVYAELGASWDIRRAESRLREFGIRRAGVSTGQPAVAGWNALVGDEVRVAELVALGRSNPEIATELALSRRVVQAHVSRIMQKLGVDSRPDLVGKVSGHSPSAGTGERSG
ncbi:BTAD domain-containing putative transcriptional regulator [Kutzneria kofuensis]|uniref:DNA-binding SARP family transcriptional activator/DNA-binding CsgD family transcriptional regulator n=1 Tax=Kutzneria kofuensis TaxID=103725 RepID=A0A7W9KB76_9PSEU|nr:BTAD domain-containing putative transcriptional regulator [Kutzneria kofuensis]MBB5889393.1 DNA-binding SARP family transcriptional activator/DNA-binding CsgD family transcriptional regulator [Kutzneria kofuensis]